VHHEPAYYAVRNHILDFLITRSRSFNEEIAGQSRDPRHPPLVELAIPSASSSLNGAPAQIAANAANPDRKKDRILTP
jgi:nitrate/nitrite transport system ATP-binding protein